MSHREAAYNSTRTNEVQEIKPLEISKRVGFFIDSIVSVAQTAEVGIMSGDEIVSVGGKEVKSAEVIDELIVGSNGVAIEVGVRRADNFFNYTITPVFNEALRKYDAGFSIKAKELIAKKRGDKEYECERGYKECKDVNGTLICTMVLDLDRQKVMMPSCSKDLGSYPVDRVDSLVLVGKDGKEFDVLERFNKHEVLVLVDKVAADAKYAHFVLKDGSDAEVVSIRSEAVQSMVSTLLHEFTHVEQDHSDNEKTQNLLILYGSEKQVKHYNESGYTAIRWYIDRILFDVPEAESGTVGILDELRKGEEEKKVIKLKVDKFFDCHHDPEHALKSRITAFDWAEVALDFILKNNLYNNLNAESLENEFIEALNKVEAFDLSNRSVFDDYISRVLAYKLEYQAIELRQKELIKKGKVLSILSLPTQIIERDAERGSLEGLRAIRQETGFDLLSEFEKEDYSFVEGPIFEAYMHWKRERQEDIFETGVELSNTGIKASTAGCLVKRYMQSIGATLGNMRRPAKDGQIGEMPKIKKEKK